MPTAEALTAEPPKAQMETPHVARIISSDSIPAGGFTPGTILADRYRVIGLLGRGGMGEVYRADDLKLGQAVALKFLPPKLAEDPVRRERFFAEVRITRQLSHPNICRVYDIQEIEGRHFLSMEFIDGEDLASLIRRIGHLSNEKALDIARQLAAGLAAAHERGVLHRDLKPANIMLDGHGRVRITDFGLAIVQEDETQAAEIAGTPAYMAPEQLAGKGATVRSDIYSLGLVLYEIYTGKKAFTAATLAELREQKETHTPRAISELREGMDPVVERLIRRCMERDPNARPASMAQLAMALPGGDPLAAALAAGETPSPEMVAASGSKEGLRPALAWGILAFIFLGTLAILWMNDRVMLHRRIPFDKPENLVVRSHEILKKLGYAEKPANSAYTFHSSLTNVYIISDKTANRWKKLSPSTILFRYHQSPKPLMFIFLGSYPKFPFPPDPGEIRLALDMEGHLFELMAGPPQAPSPAKTELKPDWPALFEQAGLDIAQWKQADPQAYPPTYADTLSAWEPLLPNQRGLPERIEAAALEGRPIYFRQALPRGLTTEMLFVANVGLLIGDAAGLFFLLALIIGGLFFARRNLRLGRGDRRYATRLALFVGSSFGLMSILGDHHANSPWEIVILFLGAMIFLLVGGIFWILYIALEPFVRRRWPQILVSWARLLSGDWRDPLIARDALVGCAGGVLGTCIYLFAGLILPPWLDHYELWPPLEVSFKSILGTPFFVSALLSVLNEAILACMGLVALLFFLRALLKNQAIALAVCLVLFALLLRPSGYWAFAIALVLSAILLFVLLRFGLVAASFGLIYSGIVRSFPITLQASAWYSGVGYGALAILAIVVLYAFRYSLGGRPLLSPSRLDD
jgi:hypothetical protein